MLLSIGRGSLFSAKMHKWLNKKKRNKNNHRHGGKSTKVIHQETKNERNRQVKRLGERHAQLEARKQNAKQRLGHRGEEEHSSSCRPK